MKKSFQASAITFQPERNRFAIGGRGSLRFQTFALIADTHQVKMIVPGSPPF